MTKKQRRTFTPEFKHQLVQLYTNGRPKKDIVEEYQVSKSILDNWIKQSQTTGSFKAKDNRTEDEKELLQLRKEIKQLQMENDILKQAVLILGRK